jgi:hypothetical protein
VEVEEGDMKRVAGVLAATVAIVGLAAPAQAVTTKDIYMVKNLQRVDSFYVGEFVVLRKVGTDVVGARGAFSSEYFCFAGTVSNGIFGVQTWDEFNNPSGYWTRPWVYGHIKGWRKVTWSQFMRYSEGFKPGRAINYCIDAIQ